MVNGKVCFVQKVDERFETEALWCEVSGDNFIIDNIPFIAKNSSLGDTITAEFDEEDELFYFDDLVASSGNSTLRILQYDINDIEFVRNWLNKNGAESEVLPARNIIAVNIPKNVDYTPIKNFLDKGEVEGRWTYEESCLEHDY